MEDQSAESTPKDNERQGKKVSNKLVIALMIVSLFSVVWFLVIEPYNEKLDREWRAKAKETERKLDEYQRELTKVVRGTNK